jgi:hypothetical protein
MKESARNYENGLGGGSEQWYSTFIRVPHEIISLQFCAPEVVGVWFKLYNITFEVFTGVTMKNAIFLDVAPCESSQNRRFEGTYHLHFQGGKNERATNSVNSN